MEQTNEHPQGAVGGAGVIASSDSEAGCPIDL